MGSHCPPIHYHYSHNPHYGLYQLQTGPACCCTPTATSDAPDPTPDDVPKSHLQRKSRDDALGSSGSRCQHGRTTSIWCTRFHWDAHKFALRNEHGDISYGALYHYLSRSSLKTSFIALCHICIFCKNLSSAFLGFDLQSTFQYGNYEFLGFDFEVSRAFLTRLQSFTLKFFCSARLHKMINIYINRVTDNVKSSRIKNAACSNASISP